MNRYSSFLWIGVSAFLGGFAAVAFMPRLQGPALADGSQAVVDDIHKLSDRFEAVARKISPSVVAVEALKANTTANGKTKSVEESGSGVLIKVANQKSTLVLTNNHVITQALPHQITVSLADNRVVKPSYVWADPESDVAILRLDGLENLTSAPLGDSDAVKVGQWVIAVGSPFGLNQTVTHGIISARERGQISLGSSIRIKDFLQTDAAINPGSSGGPLVNLDGEVVGINTAIASHSGNNSGVAFSIPINMVRRVMNQLLEKGSVPRGYLGIQVAASFEPGDALKLGLEKVQGALVEGVYPGTPGFDAGLKANDVVLQVDGFPIRNENHLINMISGLPAGQKIRLHIWRDRKTQALDAVVGDWSKAQTRFKPKP